MIGMKLLAAVYGINALLIGKAIRAIKGKPAWFERGDRV